MLYSCLACVAAKTGSAVTAGGVDVDDVGGVDVLKTAGRDEITACISLYLALDSSRSSGGNSSGGNKYSSWRSEQRRTCRS